MVEMSAYHDHLVAQSAVGAGEEAHHVRDLRSPRVHGNLHPGAVPSQSSVSHPGGRRCGDGHRRGAQERACLTREIGERRAFREQDHHRPGPPSGRDGPLEMWVGVEPPGTGRGGLHHHDLIGNLHGLLLARPGYAALTVDQRRRHGSGAGEPVRGPGPSQLELQAGDPQAIGARERAADPQREGLKPAPTRAGRLQADGVEAGSQVRHSTQTARRAHGAALQRVVRQPAHVGQGTGGLIGGKERRARLGGGRGRRGQQRRQHPGHRSHPEIDRHESLPAPLP